MSRSILSTLDRFAIIVGDGSPKTAAAEQRSTISTVSDVFGTARRLREASASVTNTAQSTAINALEGAGYRFVSWISSNDPERPEAQSAVMKRNNSTRYAEVDQTGKVNGELLENFIKSSP